MPNKGGLFGFGILPINKSNSSTNIAGYSVGYNKELPFPYYIKNEVSMREVLSREAMFSFPCAGLGFLVAGPVGVVGGHIVGAVAGYIRHQRIHK